MAFSSNQLAAALPIGTRLEHGEQLAKVRCGRGRLCQCHSLLHSELRRRFVVAVRVAIVLLSDWMTR